MPPPSCRPHSIERERPTLGRDPSSRIGRTPTLYRAGTRPWEKVDGGWRLAAADGTETADSPWARPPGGSAQRERACMATGRGQARSRVSEEIRAWQTWRGDRCEPWRHGRRGGGGENELTHWTQVLFNISVVEFVLLAALTTLQWVRHRIRGAGWVALSFAILGGVFLVVKIDPTQVTNQNVAKSLIALLLVMPYCLFRFARQLPDTEPPGPIPGPRRHRRDRGVHLRAADLPAPGFPPRRTPSRTAFPSGWRSGSCSATWSSACSWPGGESRRLPPPGCACSPSPWRGSKSRWWLPPSVSGDRRSVWSRGRSPWRWESCS